MKKTLEGAGGAILLLLLVVIMFRNNDGDWFTPNRRVPEVTVPTPDQLWDKTLLADTQQVVIVAGPTWGDDTAKVALFQKSGTTWKKVSGDFTARIGREGFHREAERHEGDNTTPAGAFGIAAAFGQAEHSDTGLHYQQLRPGDCFISTSGPDYNTWRTRQTCTQPDVDLYAGRTGRFQHGAIVKFNPNNTPNRGSAIFLMQQTADSSNGTAGSVALAESDLVSLLKKLDSDLRPRVILGPADWLSKGTSASGSAASGWSPLRHGDTGDRVRKVQYALTAAGITTTVDGVYGDTTAEHVEEFQRRRGLTVDGVVGTETARALGLI